MQFKLVVALLVLMPISGYGQHPWLNALRGAASDAAATLELTRNDSVCVNRPAPEEQGVDSAAQAALNVFARSLSDQARGAMVKAGCANGSANIELDLRPQGAAGYQFEGNGSRTDGTSSWSAIFYLPQVERLPEVAALEPDFNLASFALPDLPAQVDVTRMSGAVFSGKLIRADGIDLVLEVPRGKPGKNRKPKRINLHKSEVFSVTFPEGEWVLYAPDLLLGDDITADEMRIYIAAQRDARQNFKVWPTVAVGVAVCGTAAVLASGGLFLTILPPLAYGALQFVPVIRIREKTISNPEYRFNEVYAEGYGRVARSRKVLGGLKGGAIGTVLGTAAYFIFLQ